MYLPQIGQEAHACRTNAAVFNMSYFAKLYLTGPQAEEAANWLFTGVTNKGGDKYERSSVTLLDYSITISLHSFQDRLHLCPEQQRRCRS